MCSGLSVLTAFAGEPKIMEPSGNSLPSVIRAPAPTKQCLPIFAPLSTIAPIPIKVPSPISNRSSILDFSDAEFEEVKDDKDK
jgi:hypothetical protein